jgi:hypothetical protein
MSSDYYLMKSLEKQVQEHDEAEKVGTYEDMSSIDVSIFFTVRDKKDDSFSSCFDIPVRRKDNHKLVSHRMVSKKDLIALGISEESIDKLVETGIRSEEHRIVKLVIQRARQYTTVSPLKDRESGEFYDARRIIKEARRKHNPTRRRYIKCLDFTASVFCDEPRIDIIEVMRKRSIIAHCKVSRVLILSYCLSVPNIPLRCHHHNIWFERSTVKSVILKNY